jgi:hypothetical protein
MRRQRLEETVQEKEAERQVEEKQWRIDPLQSRCLDQLTSRVSAPWLAMR